MKAEYDAKGRRNLVPSGEPDQTIACDDVLVAVGQENAFPWIERDCGVEFDKWNMPKVDPKTMGSTNPKVFFGGDAAFGPKNIIWAVAHGHDAALSIHKLCSGEDIHERPLPEVQISSQKMGIHEWSYDNDVSSDKRYKVPHRDKVDRAEGHPHRSRAGLRPQARARRGPALPELRHPDGVHRALVHRMRCLRRHLPDGLHHLHRERRGSRSAERLKAPSPHLDQDLYVADGLKTGRVMVKDEDVCLHCGLCAERCPTGAWDMQKYLIDMTHAGHHAVHSPISSVNDFVVRFANVNGSGSASANELFARSILRHGVPVSPRNVFPSNIQGLPTWYEVRVTEDGHLGARGGIDMMVAMNPQTWDKDVASIEPGGYLFYDSTKPMPSSKFRADITVIGVPLTAITNSTYTDPRQRQLFKNIIYLGALCALLDMDPKLVEQLIGEQYKGKEKLLVVQRPRAASRPRLGAAEPQMPDRAARARSPTRSATASSSRATAPRRSARSMAAPRCAPGIRSRRRRRSPTPSPAIASKLRHDPETGKAKYAIVQGEDELASIGIVIGAGWNGARAFTATSGPGISLMQEFIGLSYFAEIPAVIFDVQRAGPSTGMPTRTQQCDIICLRLCLAWRHQARAAVPGRPGRSLRIRARRPSISPTGCRPRSSSCSISTSA